MSPPRDPLAEVAPQHLGVVKHLKHLFPELIFVGSAYSYLQDFLPHVAQAAVRLGWVDAVAMGRMLLTYPELLSDVLRGSAILHKRICRHIQ
jgi:NADPH2 dehydrogenase